MARAADARKLEELAAHEARHVERVRKVATAVAQEEATATAVRMSTEEFFMESTNFDIGEMDNPMLTDFLEWCGASRETIRKVIDMEFDGERFDHAMLFRYAEDTLDTLLVTDNTVRMHIVNSWQYVRKKSTPKRKLGRSGEPHPTYRGFAPTLG